MRREIPGVERDYEDLQKRHKTFSIIRRERRKRATHVPTEKEGEAKGE